MRFREAGAAASLLTLLLTLAVSLAIDRVGWIPYTLVSHDEVTRSQHGSLLPDLPIGGGTFLLVVGGLLFRRFLDFYHRR